MVELKLNRNKSTVIPKVKMMELLKDSLKTLEGNQGLSVAEILKYVTTSQEVQPKVVLPRLLDTIKTAEDLGLIEKLRSDKYALTEGSTYLCGTCGGKKRKRKRSVCKRKKRKSRKRRRKSRSCVKKRKRRKSKRRKRRCKSSSSQCSSKKKCKRRKRKSKCKKRKKSCIVRCEEDRAQDVQAVKDGPSPPKEVPP